MLKMVIDLSAIAAILFAEPEARAFLAEIAAAGICRLSAANFVEVGIVVRGTRAERENAPSTN